MNDAIHVFQRDGHARAVVVLQHWNIDQHTCPLRQNLRQPAAHAAMRGQLLFVIHPIGSEALHAVSAYRDMESGVFHLLAVAVPHHNVAGPDSSLLQPLADGFDKL